MGHEITNTDNLFSVRSMPWHGLGKVLTDYPTREEAQAIAHPWEPVVEPIFRRVPVITEDGPSVEYREIEGKQAVVRSDNGADLGVTNDSLGIVSNDEMYDIAEAIQGEDSRIRYETAGTLRGGRDVWLLIRLEEPITIKGDPQGATLAYYAIQNSHDGSGSFRGQAINTRIVCANTAHMADLSAKATGTEIRFRHTKNVKSRIEEAKQALAGWRVNIQEYQLFMEHLTTFKITDAQREEFIERFAPIPETRQTTERVRTNIMNERASLREVFASQTGEGIKNTAYGLVQASIEYSQHYRATRGKDDMARIENRFRRSMLSRDGLTREASKLALAVAGVSG